MAQKLSESEINELRLLRLTTDEFHSSPLSIQISSLQKEQTMNEYLRILSRKIGAANDKVMASIFVKRYAFLSVIYLYSMTAWNARLNISYENLSIVTDEHEELWLPSFSFIDLRTESFIDDRETWRISCLENLFKHHLYPILDCLSHETKVSKLILWENIAVYIYWLYETVFAKPGTSEEVIVRSKEDFQYIVYQAPGSLFGDYHKNPLMRYANEYIYLEELDNVVRPRSTCCFSYLTKDKKYCKTCPQNCKKQVIDF